MILKCPLPLEPTFTTNLELWTWTESLRLGSCTLLVPSKASAISDAKGSSNDDVVPVRRMSRGEDGKASSSTKDSFPPPMH